MNQKGQIFILSLIVLSLMVIVTLSLIGNSLTFRQSSRYSVDKLEAANLAEAGIDRAVAALNKSAGHYSGEDNSKLGNGTYTVKITPVNADSMLITSTGFVPDSINPKSKQTVSIKISRGNGMSFTYGIQSGEGGFALSGGARVLGSVYSNGDIFLSGGGTITGDAYIAGGTQPLADQDSPECVSPNCGDYFFGKIISGNSIFSVAQGFKPGNTAALNKISLKLKKIGSPAIATVRILSDNNGKPGKTSLTSGVINSSLVPNSYTGFVDIGFISNPVLNADTLYWIVITTPSLDTSNYWGWEQDTLGGYNRGAAAWSVNWQAGNPVWTAISGDFSFKTYMGGKINKLTGNGSSNVNGNAYANTMTGDNSSALIIGKDAYYQTQSGITVSGHDCSNNTHCHPGQTDPQVNVLPVSDANIQEWKTFASASVQNGDVNIGWPCPPLASKKYVGNVTVSGGCSIAIDAPVWITGNLTISSGATVSLKSSYGESSGIIVVDGLTSLGGGSVLKGSGTAGSYMMIISTNTALNNPYAVEVSGGNSSSILYAPYGGIHLSGGSNFREATAYKIIMDGGASLSYEAGVASPFFSSGPSGSFGVIKGTYQSK